MAGGLRPRRPFPGAWAIREGLKGLFAGLLEKYPGWTFATLKRLTLRQVQDILARPAPGRRADGQASLDGHAITALPGGPCLATELADLETCYRQLGGLLTRESYERSRQKILEKYGQTG
jgi:hypothetical protein